MIEKLRSLEPNLTDDEAADAIRSLKFFARIVADSIIQSHLRELNESESTLQIEHGSKVPPIE